jgi:HAE1 family hydrophobic/amphiphilic exporter-1
MWISSYAIRKPIITTVVMIGLVLFGLIALRSLDTDEFPDVQQPIVNVAIPYPGASPDVVEREVLDRVPLGCSAADVAGEPRRRRARAGRSARARG